MTVDDSRHSAKTFAMLKWLRNIIQNESVKKFQIPLDSREDLILNQIEKCLKMEEPIRIASLHRDSPDLLQAWDAILNKTSSRLKETDPELLRKELFDLGLKLVNMTSRNNANAKLFGLALFKVASTRKNFMDAEFQSAQIISTGIPSILAPDRFLAMKTAKKLGPLGHPASQYILGLKALKDRNEKIALQLIIQAADGGLKEAQIHLGTLYQKGTSKTIPPRNLEKAFHYIQLAHEKGSTMATFLLSQMYLTGDGLPDSKPDLDRAFELNLQAATKGEPIAQHNVAQMYINKYEADPNIDKDAFMFGLEFYKMAAEQKFVPSLVALGMVYEAGMHDKVKQNLYLASHYYNTAISEFATSKNKTKDQPYFKTAQEGLKRILK